MRGWGYGKHFGPNYHRPYRHHWGGPAGYVWVPLMFVVIFSLMSGGWRILPWLIIPMMLFWGIPMLVRTFRSITQEVERDVRDFDKRKRGETDYREEKRKRDFEDAVDVDYVDLTPTSRQPQYRVGDDGELIEIDEKPKRRQDFDYV